MAIGRCGALRQVFDGKNIPLSLKLKIYVAAITSIMTYGCEAWNIDERTRAQLNGANARCLSRFTGKSSHEEASKLTRTYDMVTAVRKRRHQWLGHILRMERSHDGKERLVKHAIRVQHQMSLPGSMCMDAPQTETFADLEAVAQDREAWKKHWERISPASTTTKQRKTTTDATTTATTTTTAANTTPDTPTTSQQPATTSTTQTTAAETTTPNVNPNNDNANRRTRAPKPKPAPWSNTRRQAWARAYYHVRHAKIEINWSDMVEAANADHQEPPCSPPPKPDETLWAEPAQIPSGLSTPAKSFLTEEAWAAPAIPPSPTPSNTPTTTKDAQNSPDSTTTSPPTRRETNLRQLRLLRRNRLKRKAAPRTPLQHYTTDTPPPIVHPLVTHTSFDTSISPISFHSSHTNSFESLSPITPNTHTSHSITTSSLTLPSLTPTMNDTSHTIMNDPLNDTHTYNDYINITTHVNTQNMNDSQPSLPDHSNFLNVTLDNPNPKHILYMNGTYIHISYD